MPFKTRNTPGYLGERGLVGVIFRGGALPKVPEETPKEEPEEAKVEKAGTVYGIGNLANLLGITTKEVQAYIDRRMILPDTTHGSRETISFSPAEVEKARNALNVRAELRVKGEKYATPDEVDREIRKRRRLEMGEIYRKR